MIDTNCTNTMSLYATNASLSNQARKSDDLLPQTEDASNVSPSGPCCVNSTLCSHRACSCIMQESPFKARRIGAAMVAKNIARIFDEQFVDLEKEKRVLVYCWRGG